MRWCPTTGGAPKRRCPQLSVPLSAATLCMLALATHLAKGAADPLRPSRDAEYSARYEDFDASDEDPYSFQYEVDAPYHGTWHDRREVKSGQGTEGRFRVALPDHRLQTVTYRATHAKGFTADVQFEQHPDFDALRGGIGKAPVIGTPVVPSAPHPQSSGKALTQGPDYGYQIEVDTDYGKRQRQRSRAPVQSQGNSSSHLSSKFSSRPQSSSESSHLSQPLTSSEKSHLSQPLTSSEKSHFPLPTSNLKSFHSSRPLSSSEKPHFSRPSASRPHKKPTSRPSVVYELSGDSSLSQHSPGSLSAFVSISPHLVQHTTPLSVHDPRRPTPTPSSAGYLPSPPTVHKKVVASRPLRTRQKNTFRPLQKPQDTGSFHDAKPLSYGDKQLSRPKPPFTSSAPEEPLSDPDQDVPFPQGETVPHLPHKADPNEKGNESPATTDESFSVAGNPHRYSIRKEAMSSIRSRLNSIVHDK